MQLILHTPFGARINRAWGLALRKKFCRSFNVELQAAANDNGIVISLTELHAFPLEVVFEYVKSASAEDTLTQALLTAPMFAARWRWNALRSLAILRFMGGRKVPPNFLRMRADDLLAACFPDAAACGENLTGPIRVPDHVLVNETIDNCLREAMDVDGLLTVLRDVENGTIRTLAVDTPEPSAFCHEILNANPYAYLDDAPLEERRTRAVTLRRTSRNDADASNLLDPAAIAEVAESSWPLVRDADELHDALLTLVAVPPIEAWQPWFDELVAQHRATTLAVGDVRLWTCAERRALTRIIYPHASADPETAPIASALPLPAEHEAVAEMLRGWLESSGPVTIDGLAARLALDPRAIEVALIRLETEGSVLRGRFRDSVEEWCNRRVLARIHRLTLGALRREIEPVSTADYVRFLFRWQHVTPSSRLHGVEGTLAVIRQLEGFEIPAAAWETAILPSRVADYRRDYLDKLCYAGDVMWGRLSPHPAFTPSADGRQRRIRPTKLAPIALFAREHAAELVVRSGEETAALSHAAREVLDEIALRGAPFFADIVRGTKRLPAEVEEALWQLVAAGLVTADGFDALRALADRKRRLGENGLRARPRSSGGRWSRLISGTDRDRRRSVRAPAARTLGRALPRRRQTRDARPAVARDPGPVASHGGARRDSRRPLRGGLRRRTVRAARCDRSLRAARRNGEDGEAPAVAAYDPLAVTNGLMPGAPPRPLRAVSSL